RQPPRVIDVRVREHHRLERLGRDRERLPVPQAPPLLALEQPAVEQHAMASVLDEMTTARHRASGAEEAEGGHETTPVARPARTLAPESVGVRIDRRDRDAPTRSNLPGTRERLD